VTAPAGNPLARFVITVFLWLPVTFAVWYFTAPVLLWPAALVIRLIAKTGLSDLVRTIESDGGTLVFLTTLKPGEATGNAFISVDVNLLIYSFGLPLFAALTLAAREPRWPRILAIGYGVSLPFVVWGAIAEFLRTVAIASGPKIAAQTGFVAWQREIIAFAYQFGSLILPAVVPAVLFVVLHRAYLERIRRTGP
jgi:hypothetical protein